MRYALVNRQRAVSAGFALDGHKKSIDDKVLLNEKEVMQNSLLSGDMEERCQWLGGCAESLESIRYKTSKKEIIWE